MTYRNKSVIEKKDMVISELKKRLIDKIRKTDNEDLLQEILRLLEPGSEENDLYELSDGQRNAINEGREQIERGQFLTDAQANKEIEEWLSD